MSINKEAFLENEHTGEKNYEAGRRENDKL